MLVFHTGDTGSNPVRGTSAADGDLSDEAAIEYGLLVKLDITRRFERRNPGSNPSRATSKSQQLGSLTCQRYIL